MKFEIETENLILKILTTDNAAQVLDFYMRNQRLFEAFEPMLSDDFYTLSHQENLLNFEYKSTLKLNMVRYYIFEKNNLSNIIGTVSFRNIIRPVYSSATIGYKMDQQYQRKGYCYEAISTLIPHINSEIGIRRFEALVLPDNLPSISLLEKLNFEKEGLLKEKVCIKGRFEDHYLYAKIIK